MAKLYEYIGAGYRLYRDWSGSGIATVDVIKDIFATSAHFMADFEPEDKVLLASFIVCTEGLMAQMFNTLRGPIGSRIVDWVVLPNADNKPNNWLIIHHEVLSGKSHAYYINN